MAADPRRGEVVKRRPLSAPKNTELSGIPRIVLDDRVDGDPANENSKTPETSSVAGVTTVGFPATGDGADSPEPRDYVPHRCNSDIGLPTASMPNLNLAMSLGEGAGGDKLGVYCSPRTTRRSVDLDVGSSRDPARGEYEWLDDKSSSLRVLSASSRVGSAVSLNSVCTAHSVGLLSNDSSDEYQDNSLQDNSSSCQGERQLRRLMSYPEEEKTPGNDAGVTPRTSYSLCNLKAAQAPDSHGQVQDIAATGNPENYA
nr:hypothetical protein BaRGS_022364 [Batillaria attramentaria]